ncbi:MAG TPA: hypothetical protein VG370_06025 [Chloroflexota bacterium]|jgi:hypothetical protein|nr:hypothetical protein [Chloroflexota bacterium]
MRTVESYRGVQVHVFEPEEEVPSWVRTEVGQGQAVMARGGFTSTAALAHILDRYLDEVLREEAQPPASGVGGRPREFRR